MSSNPLLTAPRRRTEYLYPGDAEATIAAYDDQIEAAFAAESDPDVRVARKAKKDADRLAAERDAYIAEQRDSAVKVVLEAIPHRALQALYDEHPPRKGNKADESVGYNHETFQAALVRASVVEPQVTDEQWAEFLESVPAGRLTRLYVVADELTGTDVNLPKSSAATTLTRLRGLERKRRPDTE